jgi:hypothetical protein
MAVLKDVQHFCDQWMAHHICRFELDHGGAGEFLKAFGGFGEAGEFR